MTLAEADALGIRSDPIMMYQGEMLEFQPDGYVLFTRAEKDFLSRFGVWISACTAHQNLEASYRPELSHPHPYELLRPKLYHFRSSKLLVSLLKTYLAWVRWTFFRLRFERACPRIMPPPWATPRYQS